MHLRNEPTQLVTGELVIDGVRWDLAQVRLELYHCAFPTADWNFWAETTRNHGGPSERVLKFGFSGTVDLSPRRAEDLAGASLELVDIEGDEARFQVDGRVGSLTYPEPRFRLAVEKAEGDRVTLVMAGPFVFADFERSIERSCRVSMRAVASLVGLWPDRRPA